MDRSGQPGIQEYPYSLTYKLISALKIKLFTDEHKSKPD